MILCEALKRDKIYEAFADKFLLMQSFASDVKICTESALDQWLMICKMNLSQKIELDYFNARVMAIKDIFLSQYENAKFKFISDYSPKLWSDFGRLD